MKMCAGVNFTKRIMSQSTLCMSSKINLSTALFDVEGTTTSISFVRETLFSYVKENLNEYIVSHWNDDEFKEVLSLLISQAKEDVENKVEGAVPIIENDKDSVFKNIMWQMNAKQSNPPLKLMQGHVMRLGYKTGKLIGHVYKDAAYIIRVSFTAGFKVCSYSSGSVLAQKLLFENSTEGNLSKFFAFHFDTGIGKKTDPASYRKIACRLEVDPASILYFTDSFEEAVAAKEAGCMAIVVIRQDSGYNIPDEYKDWDCIINNLDDIIVSNSGVNV